MRHTAQRGFTVIEILVVVAVLGIITALAIPSFERARIKIRQNRMMTYLKMITEDQLLHYRDHGEFYPAGFSFGGFSYAFAFYPRSARMELEGQGKVLGPYSRHYAYYIYRFEPFYNEPLIYAYAHRSFGNDLDGDPFPDLWIKVGSAPPQVYYDDLTNTYHQVDWGR